MPRESSLSLPFPLLCLFNTLCDSLRNAIITEPPPLVGTSIA